MNDSRERKESKRKVVKKFGKRRGINGKGREVK